MSTQTLEFQAEAKQLLDLMIHSVYSEKDVFLRELISNASDALDKLRLEALVNQDSQLVLDVTDQHIELLPDPEARTLGILDNGIGMTREEVVSLLGTIAKSGTREFLQKFKESSSGNRADLIGQFGIGFYSSFIVADEVTVETRKAGSAQGVRWHSAGDGQYTVEDVDLAHTGTKITLKLKPVDKENGMADYTDYWTLKDIVKRYSDFVAYPIKTQRTKTEGDPPVVTTEEETLNSMKALWARPKDEISEDDYKQLYRHVSGDWNDPLETIAFKAEGTFEYDALLFIPKKVPMDMFTSDAKHGLQLYVRRVFIMDRCEELLPPYLRFMKGVVDAHDLPLNISREILQKDRHIEQIRKRIIKKVLDTLKTMKADKTETYLEFWGQFGKIFKEGIYNDQKQRDALLELSLFSSNTNATPNSLADYVSRMKPDQKDIYYLTGETRALLERSPHLEAFTKHNLEVLLLTDPVDEIWVTTSPEFQGKSFHSAAQSDLELDSEDEKAAAVEQGKEFADFLTWMSSKLEAVKEVRLSNRLTESAAVLVNQEGEMTPNFEKLMKMMGQAVPAQKRILEVNSHHPLVMGLKASYEKTPDQPEQKEMVELIYELAVLAEGGELTDPAGFSRRLSDRLVKSL